MAYFAATLLRVLPEEEAFWGLKKKKIFLNFYFSVKKHQKCIFVAFTQVLTTYGVGGYFCKNASRLNSLLDK